VVVVQGITPRFRSVQSDPNSIIHSKFDKLNRPVWIVCGSIDDDRAVEIVILWLRDLDPGFHENGPDPGVEINSLRYLIPLTSRMMGRMVWSAVYTPPVHRSIGAEGGFLIDQ